MDGENGYLVSMCPSPPRAFGRGPAYDKFALPLTVEVSHREIEPKDRFPRVLITEALHPKLPQLDVSWNLPELLSG